VLLVLKFADLVAEVVEPPMGKPAHQSAEDSTEDGGGNEDSRVPFDPKVVGLCWTRGCLFNLRQRGSQAVDASLEVVSILEHQVKQMADLEENAGLGVNSASIFSGRQHTSLCCGNPSAAV